MIGGWIYMIKYLFLVYAINWKYDIFKIHETWNSQKK